ncbi:uncharacterized protein PV07_08782 [Cladophialophora immunda]|uniref:Protein kinase domain-containing protein n=1 Tax=Cladophialophora immunda TaxID=569365 RepID=A0A0D1ZCZ1_9EURO|nr:uncharacterized protein PV07_08782 [Cladophialophora immunda]KIW25616.1 hypothetical protein PV07_08782 [Cladophialophora immunda]OQV11252.1 hypothetical protein CLAIMM_15114 [Cladophialophora immunda]
MQSSESSAEMQQSRTESTGDEVTPRVKAQQKPSLSAAVPYQPNEMLLLYDEDEKKGFKLQVLRLLEGGRNEGFTMSCCMLVRVVDAAGTALEGQEYVLKIFDFKLAHVLRSQYGCGNFTTVRSDAVNNLAHAPQFGELLHQWRQPIDVATCEDSRTVKFLLERGWTISKFELVHFALHEDTRREIQTDEQFPYRQISVAEAEVFLLLAQQEQYSIHRKIFSGIRGLGGFPSFVAGGRLRRPEAEPTSDKLALVLTQYPAILMSLVAGVPLHQLPKDDMTDDDWYNLHMKIHEKMVMQLWREGIQHGDVRSSNVLIDLTHFEVNLIDVGALKFLETAESDDSRPGHLPTQFDCDLEDHVNQMILNIAPRSYSTSTRASMVATMRFRAFICSGNELDTLLWSFIMESLWSSVSLSRHSHDFHLVAEVLRHGRRMMDHEWKHIDGCQEWHYRAVIRLARLFCTPSEFHAHRTLERFLQHEMGSKSELWQDCLWHREDLQSSDIENLLHHRVESEMKRSIELPTLG